MKVLLVYVLWLVVMLGTVESKNKNGNDHNTTATITMDIQKVELEINQLAKHGRHLDLFKLNEKLKYLENLKNLLSQHLANFINDKLNLFHKAPTPEPPTTTEESTTEGMGGSGEMPTTTLIPNNTDPVPCYQENDLAVAIDASGSVEWENYKISLEFAARLLSTWKQYEKNGVAAAVYASTVRPIFTFNEGTQLDEDGVRTEILSAPYLASGTASHLALDWALNEHISNNSTVQKNLVFLTDGFSDNPLLTLDAAQRLARENIRVFAVGVGSAINQGELLQIADNKHKHVFTTSTFMDLLDILKPVSEIICV